MQRTSPAQANVDNSVACEVFTARTDGMGTRRNYRRFTADGRILEGTGANYYATKGIEKFHYDADGRLVRLDSEEGSRDERMVGKNRATLHFEYDERGLLVRERTHWQKSGEFPSHLERTFSYTEDGLLRGTVEEGPYGGATETIRRETHYSGGRVIRHDVHLNRYGMPTVNHWHAAYDEAGRLVSIQMEGCAEGKCGNGTRNEYTYDEHGRLVRDEIVEPKDDNYSERATLWTYDSAGRVRSVVRRTVYARTGRVEERPLEYHYDERGLLVSTSADGRTDTEYEYKGNCNRVDLGPEPPSAESLMGTRLCLRSPVQVLSTCFEPRARAIAKSAQTRGSGSTLQTRPRNFGEGTVKTGSHEQWVDFVEKDVGFSIRFPESPSLADRGMRVYAWARSEPLLALYVEVYPVNPSFARQELLQRYVAEVTRTEEEGDFGDITHLPAWLQTKSNTIHQGHPAMNLEGEYAAGSMAKAAIRKKGRVVIVGKLAYFVCAMFAAGDPAGLRAADYFLSTFTVFEGKNPPAW